MNRLEIDLRPSDWILIGYLLGLGLWWFIEWSTAGHPEESSRREQRVDLSEDHLRRLEDGSTVSVRRWHGHDLVLDGSVVVDAEQIEGDQEDG